MQLLHYVSYILLIDLGDGRESGFSSHVYEVVQESPSSGLRGLGFGSYETRLFEELSVEHFDT
ncbi:hypothetical protein TSMEX_005602 [Taenia solium]|eukprot:TsM_000320400 transcript=TsM_000320400 gene=TsM_000320400